MDTGIRHQRILEQATAGVAGGRRPQKRVAGGAVHFCAARAVCSASLALAAPLYADIVPQGDRFISSRPDHPVPLDTTPRTRRIANVFGLIDDRVLKFADPFAGIADSSEYNPLRVNFSTLLSSPTKVSPTSCVANLGTRKQFILALDGPGVPSDPFAYPLTWSPKNLIAVACGKDVYYQNLDSRVISHLCRITKTSYGRPTSVQWSSESPSEIALGTTLGSVQLWDSEEKKVIHRWRDMGWEAVGGMDWRESVLAVGLDGGAIEFYDTRDRQAANRLELHRSKVHGVKWSPDGKHLASSDQQGVVYIWDVRAGKCLSGSKRMGGRIKHGAPVKVRLLIRLPRRTCSRGDRAGSVVVSVAARAARHRLNIPRRQDPRLHREVDLAHPPAPARPLAQHRDHLPPVVATLEGAPQHARHVVGPQPPQDRDRAARRRHHAAHQLHHSALLPLVPPPPERERALGRRRPQLPEPGRHDDIHDLPRGGGDEDVEGVEHAGAAGAQHDLVRPLRHPLAGAARGGIEDRMDLFSCSGISGGSVYAIVAVHIALYTGSSCRHAHVSVSFHVMETPL